MEWNAAGQDRDEHRGYDWTGCDDGIHQRALFDSTSVHAKVCRYKFVSAASDC
jgi:hypothetical protein